MLKMYELVGMYNELRNMEIEDENVFLDTLEGLEGDIESKADNIACIIKEHLAEAEAIKNEEKRLAERRKSIENKAEKLKVYLFNSLKAVNMNKIETARNKLSIRKNPSKLVLVNDFYIDEYVEEIKEIRIDKAKIKEDLKAGKIVEGAMLEQTERIDIK